MHSTKCVSHVTVTCSCITKTREYGDRPQTIFHSVSHFSRIGLGMSLAIRRNLHLATNTRERSAHNLIDVLMYGLSDAVQAHSCVDPLMPNSFLSKNTTVNDKSTAGRFDPKVFVNCVQEDGTQLTKTFGSKHPAVDLSITVVFLLKKEFGISMASH